MPSNDSQERILKAQHAMLTTHFAHDPNTYVGTDVLMSYTVANRKGTLAPDLLVAFGVPTRARSSYNVREEGKVPDFVLEVASRSTFERDLGHKKDEYERLGVREYCVLDPVGGMHWPRLQLFRLVAGVYKPVRYRGDPDGRMAVTSETLGLELRLDENGFRLWDPKALEDLLDHLEEHNLRLQEHNLRLEERALRIKAEERADRNQQLADSESRARRKAEAELAELKEQIRRQS